jgi:hypothetical protein
MDPVTLDNLNRSVGGIITSLQDLQNAITSATTGSAKSVEPDKKGPENSIGELEKIMQSFVKDFKETVAEQKKYMEDVVNSMKSVSNGRSEKRAEKAAASSASGGDDAGDDAKREKQEKLSEERRNRLEKLQKKMKNVSKDEIGIMEKALVSLKERNIISIHQYENAEKLNEEQMKLVQENMRLIKLYGNDNLEQAKSLELIEKKARALRNFASQVSEIKSVFSSMEGALGLKTMETLTGGLVTQEVKYTREIRAAAYETEGLTKNSRGLQRAYEDIGTTVSSTGADRTKYQESYLKALKSGVKDLKLAKDITKSQLNTEIQLGMEAGSLQDTFQSFAQTGRMTKGQISDMGRGMREVAKNTGLTGEALKGAIESSREIVNQLRNASNLTSMTAKNVIELSANAKKLGVDQQMQTLQAGLASGAKLIMESSQQTQTAIFMAASKVGKMNEAMNGTLMSTKEGVKSLGKGLEGILRDFGVGSLEEIDQLSAEAKTRLNIQLKSVVGMELGEFRSLIESVNESGKGLGERLEDINKKMKANITADERKALMEEQRKLKASKQLEMLTALDEAAKGAKDMNGALAKFGERKKDFEGDLKSLGSSWQDSTQVAKDALKGAIENVNKGLKDAGKGELKIDASEIEKALKDPAALRELTAKIADGDQKIATAQKAQLDPVSQTNQTLSEINDTMRNMSQNIISKGFNSLVGKGLVTFIVLGTIAAAIAGMVIQTIEIKKLVKKIAMGGSQAETGTYGGEEGILGSLGTVLGGTFSKFFGKKEAAPAAPAAPATPVVAPAPEAPKTPKPAAAPKTADTVKPVITPPVVTPATPPVPPPPIKPSPTITPSSETSKDMIAKMSQAALTPEAAAKETAGLKTPAPKAEKSSKIFQDILDALKLMTDRLSEIMKCICKSAPVEKTSQGSSTNETAVKAAGQTTPSPKAEKSSKILQDILAALELMTDRVDVAANRLSEIIKCICKAAPAAAAEKPAGPKTKEANAAAPQSPVAAAEQTGGKAAKKGKPSDEEIKALQDAATARREQGKVGEQELAQEKSLRRHREKLVKEDQRLQKVDQKNLATQTATTKAGAGVAQAQKQEIKKDEKVAEAAKGPPEASVLDPEALMQGGKAMLKTAAAIALLTAGAVAIAAILFFVGYKLLSALGIDLGKVVETATTIGAMVGATVALIVAGATAVSIIEGMQEEIEKMKKSKKMLIDAAMTILPISLALLALGIVIIFAVNKVLTVMGLDSAKALEVAVTIGVVAGVVGTMAMATASFMECLEELEENELWQGMKKNTGKYLILIIQGGVVLLLLSAAIVLLGAAIVKIAGLILGAMGIDQKTAIEVGTTIAVVLTTVAIIALATIGAMFGLAAIGLMVPLIKANYVTLLLGAGALITLAPAVVALGAALIGFAKLILSLLDINKETAFEVGSTVAVIIGAVAVIALATIGAFYGINAIGTLAPLIYANYWTLLMGAGALIIFTPVVVAIATALLAFIGGIMKAGKIDASTASKTAEDVGTLLMATAAISIGILGSIYGLAGLGYLAGTLYMYIPMVIGGAIALLAFTPVVILLATAIISMTSSMMKGKIDPKKANETADALGDVLMAAGKIATGVLLATGALAVLGLAMTSGIFWGIAGLAILGAIAIKAMTPAVAELAVTLVKMGDNIGKTVTPRMISKSSEIITAVTDLVSKLSNTMTILNDKIVPMTKSGWFVKSPVRQIEDAKIILDKFLPAMSELIGTIIKTVLDKFKNTRDAGKANEILKSLSPVVEESANIIKALSEKVLPFTKKDGIFFGGKSSIEKISDSKKDLEKFFKDVVELMKDGIISPITKIGNVDQLKTASVIMTYIGTILSETGKSIEGLSKVTGMMTKTWGQWITGSGSTTEQIDASKTQFAAFFKDIASFVKTGLVEPINKEFNDTKKLSEAAKAMEDVGKLISTVSPVIKGISEIMGFVNRTWIQYISGGGSTMGDILNSKDKFASYFFSIASFVKTGIVDPVVTIFKDVKSLNLAALILDQITKVTTSVTTTIKNLAEAIALMSSSKGWIEKTPMQEIIDNKKLFSKWFKEIGIFVRDGIVIPTLETMKGIDIGAATKIIISMARIASSITPMIKNLASAIGLMSAGGEENIDTECPVDRIIASKEKFRKFFREIAKFMKEGIVDPIIDVMPDPKNIMAAAKIMTSMNSLIMTIPRVIKNLANGLIPLVDSPDEDLKNIPANKIEANTDKFKKFFRQTAKFMKEGIVEPIISEMPDSKVVEEAAKILIANNKLLNNLRSVIANLGYLFGGLNPDKTLKDSPVAMISRMAPIFADWFYNIAQLMTEGIVDPILVFFPSSEEVIEATVRLENLIKVIKMIPGFLANLGKTLAEVLPAVMSLEATGVGSKAMIFSSIFGNIANSLIVGILEPISRMPDKEGLEEVVGTLNGLANVVYAASDSMKRMGSVFGEFGIITGVFSAVFGRWDQTYFQKSFMNMANSLNYGLIRPIMKFMPKKSELDMVIEQLDGLITVLDKVKESMIKVSETMASIGELGLDFNTINAIPIDKLAALAQVSQKGVIAAGGNISSNVKPEVEINTSSIPPMSLGDDLGSRVAAKKAGDKPASSIISSKELSDISESSEKQTQLTEELVDMFRQFINMMKAGSASSSGGGGGEEPSTGLNRVRGKSPKFFRATTGQVSRGPGKQCVNLGPPGP